MAARRYGSARSTGCTARRCLPASRCIRARRILKFTRKCTIGPRSRRPSVVGESGRSGQRSYPIRISAGRSCGVRSWEADVSKFPIATGTYYKQDYSAGVDISKYRNIPVPTSYMAYHSDYDFVGGYDHGLKAGILHVANKHISPGKNSGRGGTANSARPGIAT